MGEIKIKIKKKEKKEKESRAEMEQATRPKNNEQKKKKKSDRRGQPFGPETLLFRRETCTFGHGRCRSLEGRKHTEKREKSPVWQTGVCRPMTRQRKNKKDI